MALNLNDGVDVSPTQNTLHQTNNPQAIKRPRGPAADRCRVERITMPTRLEALERDSDGLADAALVPAILQEPAWVLSGMNNMAIDGLETLAVWMPDDTPTGDQTLVGLVTVRSAPWQWGMPAGPLRSAVHHHVFDGTPLLHHRHGQEALTALFRQVRSPFLLESVPDGDPFGTVLEASARASHRRIEEFDTFSRGVFTCDRSAEDYLKDTHSRNRRNKFRRWRKQLRGEGTLELQALEIGETLEPWMAQFLTLEAKGWKGRNGTAIACTASDTAFFRYALAKLHGQGRLMFWRLMRDGEPVAMLYGMRHRRHVSFGKITYDEDHARQTPGALMLLDVMDWTYGRGDIDFMDACGRPGNHMIDALWKERLTVSDWLISAPDRSSAAFGAQCKAESARRALRSTAKKVYHNVKALTRKGD